MTVEYKVHVYNKSDRKVKVQCYKPNKDDKWGKLYSIKPRSAQCVYTAGWNEQGPDLEITQYDTVKLPSQENKDVRVKQTRFKSGKDQSWIVKEGQVVEQDHGEALDKEKKKGKKRAWKIEADSITLEDIQYELPEMPDEWKPGIITSAVLRNRGEKEATLSGTLTCDYTESHTWSHKAGLKLSVKTELKAGAPALAEGKIEVGVEASYEYTWGGETSEGKSWAEQVSVPVSPHKKAEITGQIFQAEVTVPYTATFILGYKGTESKLRTKISGEYKGVPGAMMDLQVSEQEPLEPEDRALASSTVPMGGEADISHKITLQPGSKASLMYNEMQDTVNVDKDG
jgi:hypothetical protein